MGSEKITVGQVLVQKSGRRFFDLDQYIEQRQRKTISQISVDEGEQTLRRLETEAAREPSPQKDLAIATGGGAVLREENVDTLRQNGVIVLLDASLDTLECCLDGVSGRLLLQRDDRQESLCVLYVKRMPSYRAVVQLCADADHDPDTVSEQVLQRAELLLGENARRIF